MLQSDIQENVIAMLMRHTCCLACRHLDAGCLRPNRQRCCSGMPTAGCCTASAGRRPQHPEQQLALQGPRQQLQSSAGTHATPAVFTEASRLQEQPVMPHQTQPLTLKPLDYLADFEALFTPGGSARAGATRMHMHFASTLALPHCQPHVSRWDRWVAPT